MNTIDEVREIAAPRDQTKSIPAFRCFAYQEAHNLFVAECVDLNLMVKAKSLNKAVCSLNEAVGGYLAVVLESDTSGLVPRYSPMSRRLLYHWMGIKYRLANFLNRPPTARPEKRFLYSEHCHASA